MLGDNQKTGRLIYAVAGAPSGRCECCLRTATQTVIIERPNGARTPIACCKRHANMAGKQLRRFLLQRANRDRHFAETLAAMAQQKAG